MLWMDRRYTVELLYSGHPWDKYKCPEYRGVLISGVNLYYKAQFGNYKCPYYRGVLISGCPQ